MSGIILAFAIQYGMLTANVPTVLASMEGGYHVGPVYATVLVATDSWELERLFSYRPTSVEYDFRLGIRFDGFDFGISRACEHAVFGSSTADWGIFALFARWSSWP